MFGLITYIKTAVYSSIVVLYIILFFRLKSTQKTEDEDQGVTVVKELKSKNASLEHQLSSKIEAFESLKQEYNKQLAQRVRDKVLVDQAYEEVLWMETECKEIQEAHHVAKELLQTKIDQHQNKVEVKDKQLAKLKEEYFSFLDKLEKSHAADLELIAAKAAEEQRLMEAAHLDEVRALTEASKTNRSAWKKAKQSMETDMERMDREFQDGLQANKDEITRVTELTYRLAAENRLLAGALDEIPAKEMREHANDVFKEVRNTREELEQTHIKLKIATEKIENILEAMQQQRDHYEAHGAKEQEAQAQVYDLQQEIIQLQEKLKLRDDLLHATNLNGKVTTAKSVKADAVYKSAIKIDELQAKLCVAQEENAALQAKVNKVDEENCSLSMQLDIVEADLHKAQERVKMLDEKQRLINKEHELLFMAVENNQALTAEDKEVLQQHLREASASNDYLRERNYELKSEVSQLKSFTDVVEEKCNIQIEKACKEADFWENMYWDEAVPKVERLTQEIHELNKELGRENIYVQERLERNVVVADRNALRYACKYTLSGVDPELIPAEYHDPGFVPGWIPATHDALRTLRPLGWAPVAELGKVWLAPMYKPFTQEDAAYRLRAQQQTERKEHRANMNASPPPEADYEVPFEPSSSKSRSARNVPHNSENTHEVPQVPTYNPEWMKKRSELTREAYENMDTDLKLGVLRMIGVNLEEESNQDDEMF